MCFKINLNQILRKFLTVLVSIIFNIPSNTIQKYLNKINNLIHYLFNPLRTKLYMFYLKTQSVPRCKHSLPLL